MRRSYVVLIGLLSLALTATSCASSDDGSADTGPERFLLISGEQRDGVDGPQALFEGTLILTEENCVVAEAEDGTTINLDFPAGTIISPEDPNTIVMNFGELTIGDEVSLGGGEVSSAAVERELGQLPEGCRFEQAFGVYTLA